MRSLWCVLLFCGVFTLAGCEPITIDLGDDPPSSSTINTDSQPCPGPCLPDGRCCPYKTVPPVDLPPELRTSNYGGGSCLHAAFQDVLKWQHQEPSAVFWRRHYGGGAGLGDITAICDRLHLKFAYTTAGDLAFLEWASRTRRGAAIYWLGGAHAITFCGFVGDHAAVIDNNAPWRVRLIPRETFLRSWRASGGRAVTPVYSPAPPRPWI